MPRWKSTEQILSLSKDGEVFDENWMNYDSIYQYMPPSPRWEEDRLIKFEDVDIWEVIYEASGPLGVYAAWCPYAHYFIVMHHWRIVDEFRGLDGERQLYKLLTDMGINLSLNKVWVDDKDIKPYFSYTSNNTIIY
jgi:hypothetical protein